MTCEEASAQVSVKPKWHWYQQICVEEGVKESLTGNPAKVDRHSLHQVSRYVAPLFLSSHRFPSRSSGEMRRWCLFSYYLIRTGRQLPTLPDRVRRYEVLGK